MPFTALHHKARRSLVYRAAWLALTCIAPAWSQGFPDKPIRLVVPYAPGGSADIAARLIADDWGKRLGQPVVVDNKAGASGNLGMDAVAKSRADGYTLSLNTVSQAINPSLFGRLPFDTLKDLKAVGTVATSQHVLVVSNQVPAKTVRELVALAKAGPGKLSFGSAGTGSTFHMAAELFKAESNTFILHVPYRGGGPALIDTISGQVDMSFPVLSAAQQHVAGGKLRALAVTGPKRSPILPEVPTMAEAGLPNYAFETWFVVSVPAGVVPDTLVKLNRTLNETLNAPEVRTRLTREGFDAWPQTPGQSDALIRSEYERWKKLVAQKGIKAD
ncbi:Tripartite-type tricarboxylate transporter, receptor component TctC [Polaromonas sp. YR568]|uniref:tripartite tricarboxylate transporter substrate binding protein n=1 Tax=Polaromonas sp. YR568 TaxID=1855301 RepID=UPI0008EDFF05|nr:tripartite tricarboxylate transporter substrate binding protein [Polaromonas sp. YR568]SFU34864.1 Tripartite-type tricarboxylate transporter, receptor component TctC [Polaromonas sp. YR568]